MKKLLLIASIFCSSTYAQLPASFIPTLESFTKQHNLFYVPEPTNNVNREYLYYGFSTSSNCNSNSCTTLKVYFNQDKYCVPKNPNLFGELPLNIPHVQAMYFSPKISDKSSQTHDFVRLSTKYGCYELAMGKEGSNYRELLELTNRLATMK